MSFAFSDLANHFPSGIVSGKPGRDQLGYRNPFMNCDFKVATSSETDSLFPCIVESGSRAALKFDGPDSLKDLCLYTGDSEMARTLTIHTDASIDIGYGFRFELYGRIVVEGYGGWPKEVRADKAKMRSSARLEAEAIKLAFLVLSRFGPLPKEINIQCDNKAVVDAINGEREKGAESIEINQIRELYPTVTLRAEWVPRKRNKKADKLSKMTAESMIGLMVLPFDGPANTVNTVRAGETGEASNNGGTGDAASTGGAGYSGSTGSTSDSSSSGDTGSTGEKGVTNSGSGCGSDASAREQAAGSNSINKRASAAGLTATDTD